MSIRQGLFTVLLALTLSACSGTTDSSPYLDLNTEPAWVRDLVGRIEQEPVANPPASLWRYEYHGDVVYFIPQTCCDIPSALYDADGNVICSPDGGFSGGGDGRCPDFMESRMYEVLLWRDPRRSS